MEWIDSCLDVLVPVLWRHFVFVVMHPATVAVDFVLVPTCFMSLLVLSPSVPCNNSTRCIASCVSLLKRNVFPLDLFL